MVFVLAGHPTSRRLLLSLNPVSIHYLYHSFKHKFYKQSYWAFDVSWVTVLPFQEDYISPDDTYGFSFVAISVPYAA